VEITDEAIHKYAADNVYDAICQVVWNGIDAEAKEVNITLSKEKQGLSDEMSETRITRITIEDNGTGMDPNETEEYFTQFNKSWKKNSRRNDGRCYHGQHGVGRFKYFALGDSIKWETAFAFEGQVAGQVLTASYSHPKEFIHGIASSPGGHTGTKVVIEDVSDRAQAFQTIDELKFHLLQRFALYMKTSFDFRLSLDCETIDPAEYIDKETDGTFTFDPSSTVES